MFLAPLNYDKYFRKVFCNENISKRFLEDFLETGINEFEMLKGRHRVTDDASLVEFDFRCRIQDSVVILDMQQWYKRDVSQRFYLYHTLNTGLQLEELSDKRVIYESSYERSEEVKDYRALHPVITLIWMADDAMGFSHDYVAYFLSKNRLIFMLQRNIVKNKTGAKYKKWFEFAQKTKNPDNKREDFLEYMDDEIFSEIMRRLSKEELADDDFVYIAEERKIREQVERFEQGIREVAWKDGKEEGWQEGKQAGKKEGIEEGREEGRKEGRKEGERSKSLDIAGRLKAKGFDNEDIAEASGLSLEEIARL